MAVVAAVGDSVGVIKVSAARNHLKAVTNFDEVSDAHRRRFLELNGVQLCTFICAKDSLVRI